MLYGSASGVKGYIWATATVRTPFAVDLKGHPIIDCTHCRFFRRSSGRCGLNDTIPTFPEKYIGAECPLHFEEDEVVE